MYKIIRYIQTPVKSIMIPVITTIPVEFNYYISRRTVSMSHLLLCNSRITDIDDSKDEWQVSDKDLDFLDELLESPDDLLKFIPPEDSKLMDNEFK